MTEQNVHRILDQAFAGVELTPDVQDLKEEIRANLIARVAEVAAASGAGEWAAHERLVALHRVRPRSAVVVGLVVLSAALTTALVLIALGATGLVALSPASAALKGVAGALLAGGIVLIALCQETTAHYPMPVRRAAGWGAATAAGVLAVALGTTFAGDTSQLALLEAAIGLAVAATAGLVTLGVTQTNRTKGWVRDSADQSQNRFSQDPAAAARFGIYTGALWLAALSAVVVVGLTGGWLWSWTPLAAALLAEMVLLARMQFPTDHH